MRAGIKITFTDGRLINLEYSEVEERDALFLGIQVAAFANYVIKNGEGALIEVTIRPPDTANGDH